MNVPVTLPALGDAVESATISAWLVSVGDTIAAGDPLVEVSTDKVDTEIESPSDGILLEIRIAEDEIADVGAVIAIVGVGDAAVPETSPLASSGPQAGSPREPQVVTPQAPMPAKAAPVPSVPAAPAPTLTTAGEEATSTPASSSPLADQSEAEQGVGGTTQKLTRLRKTIATRMVESLQTSAQLTTIVEVDVTDVGRTRREHNSALVPGQGVKLSYLPFIAVAALEGLRRHPEVNSTVDITEGTVTYPDAQHLGVAVDTPKGLFVPVIRDAGTLSVIELAEKIADVAERTRTSKIGVDELQGGTFTITNTGSRGALMDTPIINQPQVAILATGTVTRRPVAIGWEGEDESIAIRSMLYLSLTYDHRIIDGADAASYLTTVKARLEGNAFTIH